MDFARTTPRNIKSSLQVCGADQSEECDSQHDGIPCMCEGDHPTLLFPENSVFASRKYCIKIVSSHLVLVFSLSCLLLLSSHLSHSPYGLSH